MKSLFVRNLHVLLVPLTALTIFSACKNSNEPAWFKENQELIAKHQLEVKNLSNLPENGIEPNLRVGEAVNLGDLDLTEIQPGVNGKVFWSKGTMTSVLNLEPNAVVEEEELPADRFLFVLEGSIEQLINGGFVPMLSREREEPDGTHSGTPRTDFVYLEKGSSNAIKAGPDGAKIMEIYSPYRLDYLEKAGVENLPSALEDLNEIYPPNIEPGKVYDFYDIQFTKIGEGAHARIISGRNIQLSFVSMDPLTNSPAHIHPQEQITYVLRGNLSEKAMDTPVAMDAMDALLVPGNMVHSASVGDVGSDVLDIFWPARNDYLEKNKDALEAYHKIIPKDAEPELLVDGSKTEPRLTFSEGPKWLNGKIYFSNMYFDQNWNGDPAQSSIVELDPDGSYRNITEGKMQANGLYPYKNGNLIVCDMLGHRVVEMTTEGKVVRVIADSYNGKPIDGPNDIITDAKGGIYFTDPQFTMEAEKFQPGRAVYYITPKGEVKRLVEPNEFAMPNGILLSPDGKTLYINNCYDDESWYPVNSEKENFIWAYDVNEDGTIANGRKFAKLFLTGQVLDRKGKSSSADGMAIDTMGNIYVATYYGVQIFNAEGNYVGMINLPSFPVSLCFGGEDMKTLYMVSYDKVYKIRTNMKGFVNYL
ncbi:SMP-30/gluconolactonase/LRE family protein [Muricauda sp. MAR_2010_75]|uniref:SMP-30/gluconolactonase/LRE family protein n=1 Tax=Allomuricauda sp. MAR_2010_75 TaxID=1250232 RepID=UPI00068A54C4|nr:SMP-30/gluconolactonase/LRE family protein [Muricauda sp. MAR_2010_75]